MISLLPMISSLLSIDNGCSVPTLVLAWLFGVSIWKKRNHSREGSSVILVPWKISYAWRILDSTAKTGILQDPSYKIRSSCRMRMVKPCKVSPIRQIFGLSTVKSSVITGMADKGFICDSKDRKLLWEDGNNYYFELRKQRLSIPSRSVCRQQLFS